MDGSSIEGAGCPGQWSVESKFQTYQVRLASVAHRVECKDANTNVDGSSPIDSMRFTKRQVS